MAVLPNDIRMMTIVSLVCCKVHQNANEKCSLLSTYYHAWDYYGHKMTVKHIIIYEASAANDNSFWFTLNSKPVVFAASLMCPWSGGFKTPFNCTTLGPTVFADTWQLWLLKAEHFQQRTPAILPLPLFVNKYPSIDRSGCLFCDCNHSTAVLGRIPAAIFTTSVKFIYSRRERKHKPGWFVTNVCK